MSRTTLSFLYPHAVAILATLAALLVRWLLWPVLSNSFPYLIFFPAVLLAAYRGGLWPGLLAAFLSALAAVCFLIAPGHSFEIATARDGVGLALFLLVGVCTSALGGFQHRATARLEAALTALRQSDERQRVTL